MRCARLMQPAGSWRSSCRRKFHSKGITFPSSHVISLCGVVVMRSRVGPKVPGSSPTFFPRFFGVVVFYKYMANEGIAM